MLQRFIILLLLNLSNYVIVFTSSVLLVQNEEIHIGTSLLPYLNVELKEIDLFSRKARPVINTILPTEDPIKAYKTNEVLQIWANAWAESGWNPVVITYGNCTTHSNFQTFVTQLRAEQLPEQKWPQYLRFIAMSLQDGGWYSEPYMIPFKSNFAYDIGSSDSLPNDGKFTMHQERLADLISANKKEWDRMTDLIMENISYNDVGMLNHLRHIDNSVYAVNDVVLSSLSALKLRTKTEYCEATKNKVAANIIHMARLAGHKTTAYLNFLKATRRSMSRSCYKPTMYTFFSPAFHDIERLQMEVEQWKDAWSTAGWNPVVLSIEDAKRNAFYDTMRLAFENGKYPISDYNRMCFYRWLAMAMYGGWMTDMDTLPLYSQPEQSLVLPNNANFTSYQMHVPSMMSASASEWDRMSRLLYNSYIRHSHDFWSDMLALRDVYRKGNRMIFHKEVIGIDEPYEIMIKRGDTFINMNLLRNHCPYTLGMKAVHFSHYSCELVKFCQYNREVSAGRWIQNWNEQCLDENVI